MSARLSKIQPRSTYELVRWDSTLSAEWIIQFESIQLDDSQPKPRGVRLIIRSVGYLKSQHRQQLGGMDQLLKLGPRGDVPPQAWLGFCSTSSSDRTRFEWVNEYVSKGGGGGVQNPILWRERIHRTESTRSRVSTWLGGKEFRHDPWGEDDGIIGWKRLKHNPQGGDDEMIISKK